MKKHLSILLLGIMAMLLFVVRPSAAAEKRAPSVRVAAAARYVVGKRVAGSVLAKVGEKRAAKGEADRAYAKQTVAKANGDIAKASANPHDKASRELAKQAGYDKNFAQRLDQRGSWRIETGSALARAGQAMRAK